MFEVASEFITSVRKMVQIEQLEMYIGHNNTH